MTSSLGTSQRWPSRAPKSSFENGNKVMLADEFCQELHDHYGRTPSGILGSVLNELVFVRLLQLELMHVINISATLALIGRAAEAHWAVPWLKGQAPAMVGDPVPSAPASPAAGASALGSAPPAPGADAGEESWEAWWDEVFEPSGDPAPPSPALKVSEHPAGEPSASAPAPPSGATLRPLRAPAPAPPSGAPSALPSAAPSAAPPVASPEGKAPIGAGKAAARVPAVAAPAELDPAKASDALLALARAIRKPCAYIGHSTFILLALCKGCRLYI